MKTTWSLCILAAILVLVGCTMPYMETEPTAEIQSNQPSNNNSGPTRIAKQPNEQRPVVMYTPQPSYQNTWRELPYNDNNSQQLSRRSHKLLTQYVEHMSMQLIENYNAVDLKQGIGVTSLVDLDSGLEDTNLLGNLLSELFIHEMQEYGFRVIDYKNTGLIRTNSQGDFALSRDPNRLDKRADIQSVLTGTLTYHDDGVLVNARVTGLDSKAVYASAQAYIPYFLLEKLRPHTMKDGVRVAQ